MGNWLRDHFYRFVYPALCYAKYNWDQNGGSPYTYSADPQEISKFFPVRIPTTTDYQKLPPELAKLRALCDQLQIDWSTCSYFSELRADLHFDVLRETLLSAERKRQTFGCSRLLLAGRDVWTLEVMAQKRGIKTLFLPQISRNAAASSTALSQLLKKNGFVGDELLVDTGFVGSIPRKISEATGINLRYVLMSQDKKYYSLFTAECAKNQCPEVTGHDYETIQDQNCIRLPNQLFPQRKNARKEALDTEYLPKYWKSGTIRLGRIVQYLSEPQEIVLAAILTSDVWRGVKHGRDGKGKHKKGGKYNEQRSSLW